MVVLIIMFECNLGSGVKDLSIEHVFYNYIFQERCTAFVTMDTANE
jgi:hypothetical protein